VVSTTTADGFSLTNCGPVDRALLRAGLESADTPRLWVRACLPALLIWLPLALLVWLAPPAGGEPAVGFYQDLSTQVRFLVFVPLLVLIEAGIGRRTRPVAAQFAEAQLVAADDRPRLDAELRRCSRAIESTLAELVIWALAIGLVVAAVRTFSADGVQFWYEEANEAGTQLSTAGWWYAVGSVLPSFLLLRWLWRYLVWCWFLFRVSRLKLALVATHPDRAAGLEFVGFAHAAFSGLAFAASCLVAGAIATRVLHEGVSLLHFQWPMVVFVVLAILVGIAPLMVFRGPMRLAREAGLLAYGTFAARYVQDFQHRWIGTEAGKAPLEASGDVQGLADIGGSLERVYAMRPLPISLRTALSFAVAAAAPTLSLLLLVMPLRDLLKLLMRAMI
jgi:hypothetical protein